MTATRGILFRTRKKEEGKEESEREREIQWERRTAAKRFCFPFCFPAFRNGEKRANCDVEEKTKTTENQSNCHGTIHQGKLLNVECRLACRISAVWSRLRCKMTCSVIFQTFKSKKASYGSILGSAFAFRRGKIFHETSFRHVFCRFFFASPRVPVCRQSVTGKNRLNLTIFIHAGI